MAHYEYEIVIGQETKYGRIQVQEECTEEDIKRLLHCDRVVSLKKVTCEGCILGLLSQYDHMGDGGCL